MVCLLFGRLKTFEDKKKKRIKYSSISHPENHQKEATAVSGHNKTKLCWSSESPPPRSLSHPSSPEFCLKKCVTAEYQGITLNAITCILYLGLATFGIQRKPPMKFFSMIENFDTKKTFLGSRCDFYAFFGFQPNRTTLDPT